MRGDLTTVSRYKDWSGTSVSGADPLIARLISSSSSFLANWINKDVHLSRYVEKRNGNSSSTMVMKNWPIYVVDKVMIGTTEIHPSTDGVSPGYTYDQYNIYLVGGAYSFTKGIQNITITYSAGFYQEETKQIPTASPYQLTPSDFKKVWSEDYSVTLNGVAMTWVDSNPSAGQYSCNEEGNYVFAAADAGSTVIVTYGSPPYDVEQACIELVASRIKERDRIGIASKSVGGESISFTDKDMSAAIKASLQSYRNLAPLT